MIPSYLQLLDRGTPGRYDITPMLSRAESFQELVADLARPFLNCHIDQVAAIDALGFILGSAIALKLGVGFIPIRKEGKLPGKSKEERFVDYTKTEKSLAIRADVLRAHSEILLIDDWIETGSQIYAAIELLESSGCKISGIACINIDLNPKTSSLVSNYFCHSILISDEYRCT